MNYKVKVNLFSVADNTVDETVFLVLDAHLFSVVLSRGTVSLDDFQRGVSPRTYSRYKKFFSDGDLYITVLHANLLPS